MLKIKNLFIILLFSCLIACGGGGGSTNPVQPTVTNETFSINGHDISTDVIHDDDTSIEMTNTSASPLSIQSIALNSESDTIKPTSTCLNKTLQQGEKCTIDLGVNGVYTAQSNIKMTVVTDKDVTTTSLPIWNYGYTNNISDPSKKLLFSGGITPANSNGYIEIKQLGIQEIKVTNAESSPLFISQVNFQGGEMNVDQGIMAPNFMDSKLSTCGGKLKSGASCSIFVSFNAIQNDTINYADTLKIWYKNGTVANKTQIGNGVYLKDLLSANCNSLGNCPIFAKTIQGHKLTLENIRMFAPIQNVDFTTQTDNGCGMGFNFESGSCNVKLFLKSYPVGLEDGGIVADVKYWVNNTYSVTFIQYATGKIHIDNSQTQQLELDAPANFANSYYDDDGVFVSNGKTVTLSNPKVNHFSMKIQKITFLPSNTNFQDIDSHQLITTESAITQNQCDGTTLQPDGSCKLQLAGGMNGYDEMGSLQVEFSIDGNTQVYTTVMTLGKIQSTLLNVSVDSPDPIVSDDVTVWKTGDDTTKTINVIASKNNVGVAIANNLNDSGTYVILNNFKGVLTSVFPNCRGYTSENHYYMYPNDVQRYYCAYEIDVSNQVGSTIPMNLILGNHKEINLTLNWQVIAPPKSYIKPVFKGNYK